MQTTTTAAIASPCLTGAAVSRCRVRGDFRISHHIVVSSPAGGARGRRSVRPSALRTWRACDDPAATPFAIDAELHVADGLHGLQSRLRRQAQPRVLQLNSARQRLLPSLATHQSSSVPTSVTRAARDTGTLRAPARLPPRRIVCGARTNTLSVCKILAARANQR
jgi:hypothetical protein